jgi:hypothetical protein
VPPHFEHRLSEGHVHEAAEAHSAASPFVSLIKTTSRDRHLAVLRGLWYNWGWHNSSKESAASMPSRHSSVVGGSSAARLVNCPGANALLARLPAVADRDSAYSTEGSALHEAIEQLIAGELTLDELRRDPPTIITVNDAGVEMTAELIRDALEPAFAFWENFLLSIDHWELETEVTFHGIPGAFGTADVLARNEVANETHLLDWKFGAGVAVRAVYDDPDDADFEIVNEQLMFYATAARHTRPELFPPGCRVVLTIVQPRAQGETRSMATVSLDDLDAFAGELRAAVKRSGQADAPTKPGHWCRFEPCRTICPHHTGPLFDLDALGRAAAPAKTIPAKADPGYLDTLRDILAVAPTIEAVIREARGQAHLLLSDGGSLDGWKLVQKRGQRQWMVDPDALAKAMRKLKVRKAQLYDLKLKSPAGVEKVLPKGVKLPPDLAAMHSSGTTIAPVDDKRPAVAATPDALRIALQESLALAEQAE